MSAAIRALVVLGFVFLYAPIASLVVYSFNESRLVTVWGGFSTQWYGALLSDPQILGAAWISLKIAVMSASIATALGTLSALVLVRRGYGRTLLGGLVTAPLVMPEVIIGLSLLLLFVAMEGLLGWPAGRGIATITIAHATFGTAFAAAVIQARMISLDRAQEEAAADLGARPVRVFLDVTLPGLAPALVSAWLLAFTLSLDDVVIASFVAGPGASTLPLVIFSKVRLGVSPEVNALATLLLVTVSLGAIAAAWLGSRHRA